MQLARIRGRRRIGRAVAAALTALPILAVAPAASARTATPAAPVVQVVMGAGGFNADTANPRQAGRVTFVVSNTDTKDEHDFQLLKLGRGVTVQQVLATADQAFAGDQPDPALIRKLDRMVTWLGGINAVPGSPNASMTLTLARGTYYMVDTATQKPSDSPIKQLQVVGRTQRTAVPAVSATVTMTRGNRFTTSGHLPASGSILVSNRAREPHLLFLGPVTAAATDQQIQSVFDRAAHGDQNAFREYPGTDGPAAGTGTISPGYQIVFSYNLPAGKYDLECFWPDEDTGMPHAFMGMHKVASIG